MKKILLIVFMLVSMVYGEYRTKSFDALVVQAQKENKLILVELSSGNCHYCQFMEGVFKDDGVKAEMEKSYVFVNYNVDIDGFPARFDAMSTPTFYFVSSDGKTIVDKVAWAMKQPQFLSYITEIANRELKR